MKITHKKNNLFINKELSWIEFNKRVLSEAYDPTTPLLEKIKFLSITASNFDEFFMIRVGGLKKRLKDGFLHCNSPDKIPISNVLNSIHKKTTQIINQQDFLLTSVILPELQKNITIRTFDNLNNEEKEYLKRYFLDEIFDKITISNLVSLKRIPFLTNKSLYLLVEFQNSQSDEKNKRYLCFVKIPDSLPRLILIKNTYTNYIFLEEVIKHYISLLFIKAKIISCTTIRATRNLDYQIPNTNVENMLSTVQEEVITREKQEIIRLEIEETTPKHLQKKLLSLFNLSQTDIYMSPKSLHITGVMDLYQLTRNEQHYSVNLDPPPKQENIDIFLSIKKKDILIHHPYESFQLVSDFIKQSALDKNVISIKITLYRFLENSEIMDFLLQAARSGKDITVLVELKARFDEQKNISYAKKLKKAGAKVIYGFIGYKTHCKACLISRREDHIIVNYAHLSTGNYNSFTATHYTDLSLFTAHKAITTDLALLFDFLVEGKRILKTQQQFVFKELIVAPFNMRHFIKKNIEALVENKTKKKRLLIIKLNHLVDKEIIEQLYKASQHGIVIKLIIRGMCALTPQLKGISDNIEVISIIDHYLEHSRIYFFSDGTNDKLFLGSADWMDRNLDRRIEIIYPVLDNDIKSRIKKEILNTYLLDNTKSSLLTRGGQYIRKKPAVNKAKIRAQSFFRSRKIKKYED